MKITARAMAMSMTTASLAFDVCAQALNVTAISAVNNASVLECWQLTTPATVFAGAVNYPLGNSTSGYVGVIPPRTYIGFAHAPHVQISVFLSGLGHISVPNCTDAPSDCEVWVHGGKYGMLIAADLVGVSTYGHITDFAGSDTTVIAQFPFPGNVAPPHVIIHNGPCRETDMLEL